MEAKEVIKINPDFSEEHDGFDVEFNKEESALIDKKAKERGITSEALIAEIVVPAIEKADAAIKKLIKERKR
jgi:hypothetical protein